MSKLFLIDGMSLVFRAYHAMIKSDLRSPQGEPTGAVFGFVNTITSLLEKEKLVNISVVFDTREPTFRHKMYPEYKANRDAFPEDLVPQLKRIKEFLDHAGISRIEKPGYEADDVIGTLAKQASADGRQVACITSDKDYYQLVDENISLLKPSRRPGKDFDPVGHPEVMKKFGVLPGQVIDVLALIGDSSDNVPGVKGVGEKTAIPLVQKFGTVEGIYENLAAVEKKAAAKKLEANHEMALLSKQLVTIDLRVPVRETYKDCVRGEANAEELDKFFQEMGFRTLRNKWAKMANPDAEIIPEAEPVFDTITSLSAKLNYNLVDDDKKFDKMLIEIAQPDILSVDLETDGLDRRHCKIVGIALSHRPDHAYYIAVYDDRTESIPAQTDMFAVEETVFPSLPVSKVMDDLRDLFEGQSTGICGQNIKFDSYILKRYGIDLKPIVFDTMVASYVLNPDNQHNMDAMARKWLNYDPVPISRLIGEKKSTQRSMAELAPAEISEYACEDADITLKLMHRLSKELEKEKLVRLACDIEFPIVQVLTDIEYNGVAIDSRALGELSNSISIEVDKLTADIHDEAGHGFNIDSPKQLGHILFEKLMIPPVKKTKTGYSTDVSVMTQLAPTYPIAQKILDYRQLVKLRSTYVDVLPKLVNPETGRIHTTFNQTVAATGRLSSTDPNLQNIPIRTELGRQVRKAFVPQHRDNIIMAADYSQVELRIMAHYCDDPTLKKAFADGLDIHSATAATLFDTKLEELSRDQRRIAKTVNFGIMYGLGAFGLAQRLNISRSEGSDIIKNYFAKYPGIKGYIDDTIEFARQHGYSETKLGRRRYFSDINSKNRNLRTAAERAAINMPIQGTASDIMKLAMIKVYNALREKGLKSLMMLQVHDELVFEVWPGERETVSEILAAEMPSAFSLGEIPLEIEIGTGGNWYEAH